jgi:phosphoketolase
MSANPHANGGALLQDLALPDFRDYASGVDALVFTAGTGEHSSRIRADVCRQLAFLGVALDADANAAAASREDVMIARGIRHAENPQPVPGAR